MPVPYDGPGRRSRPSRSCPSVYRSQQSQMSSESESDASDVEQATLGDGDISVENVCHVQNSEFTMTPARISSTSTSLQNHWDSSGILSRPSCATAQVQCWSPPSAPGLWNDDSSLLPDPQTQRWELSEHPRPHPGLGSTPAQYGVGSGDASPPPANYI